MTSKDRGLSPVPSNFINICLLFRIVVDEIKENEAGNGKFYKHFNNISSTIRVRKAPAVWPDGCSICFIFGHFELFNMPNWVNFSPK